MNRRLAVLIRHGDYDQRAGAPSAHQPYALTSKGEAQSRAAGFEVAELATREDWQLNYAVECSRQLRAWQTAQLVAGALAQQMNFQPHVHEDEALAERCVGAAANLTSDEIEAVIEADPRYDSLPAGWKADSHYRLPFQGAESLMEAGQRVSTCLCSHMETLRPNDRPQAKLFVGHGASFRHAAHLMGILAFDDIARLSMHHARPIILEYHGDGRWTHIGGAWKKRPLQETIAD